MRYFFSLQIHAEHEQLSKIPKILGIESNYPEVSWGHKLIVKDNAYTNFIDYFLGILDGKYDKLESIGIPRDCISIWMICEYEEQCNMEFMPSDMVKLGENGITFCISCYEKS